MQEEQKDYSILPDVEIECENISLESFDEMLSEQDEFLIAQIDELCKQIDNTHDLMHDLMEAVKKGAIDYVDSMTDTGDTFSEIKDPRKVKKINDVEIDKRAKPADVETNANWQTRNIEDAKMNPFDKNVAGNTNGMSELGAARFERYKEAYSQRLKTNTVTSNVEGNSIKTSEPKQNFESLSGLRNYRVGPVVSMPDIETIKDGYNKAVAEGSALSASGYIRAKNFEAFDMALMEKFGFKSKAAAEQWRKSNHLTIHESADGMFLVPTDVHDSSSHKGYCSMLSDILEGKEGAENAMQQYIRQEKIAYIKHEAKIRGVRAAKGLGISVVKDLLKHIIANLITSFYDKRRLIQEQGFLTYIKAALRACWEKVKLKTIKILKDIGGNALGTVGTEAGNAFNDIVLDRFLSQLNCFLLGTFKRLLSVIRQMFGSIKSALKILCSKSATWQERVFEAAKVLSAGAVAVLGFSLNEIIEKGLISMAIQVPIASFMAECLAGLFAGIFSNIVLMLFDHTKEALKVRDAQLQLSLLHSQSILVKELRINVAVLKTSRDVCGTYQFFGNVLSDIKETREEIQGIEKEISNVNTRTLNLLNKNDDRYNLLKNKYENNENF